MSQDLYITDADSLQKLCSELAQGDWITLDTEFLREKTYRPQLCLVQLGNADIIACVDPQEIDDLSPLYELMADSSVVKVLHAASQDLEIFYQDMGSVPAPIFDTQIAASLVGHGDQVGYGKLVELVCKTQLDKSQSRTDWSRRPLSEKQITYAADDVRYLRDVYHQLRSELNELGRTDWLAADFDAMTRPEKYQPDMENVWKRVKQHNRLRGVQLAVLKQLAQWREEQAVAKDKPRKWMGSDDLLIDLSRTLPSTDDELSTLRSVDANFIKHRGNFILNLVAEAKQTPKDQWPVLKKFDKLSPSQDAMVDYLWAAAKLKAAEHQITLGSVTSRKELERLVTGDESVPVMKSWRHSLMGADLAAILNGDKQLHWSKGQLQLLAKE